MLYGLLYKDIHTILHSALHCTVLFDMAITLYEAVVIEPCTTKVLLDCMSSNGNDGETA